MAGWECETDTLEAPTDGSEQPSARKGQRSGHG